MFDTESLSKSGVVSLIAFFVAIVPLVVKGLYALTRGWAQSRKEFLDAWDPTKVGDSLWLETVVMHAFGNHPPAAVIRGVLQLREPRRMLRDLSVNWRYFDGDDVRSIRWKKRYRNSTVLRRVEMLVLSVLYAVLCTAAILMFSSGETATMVGGVIVFVLALLCLGVPLEISSVSSVMEKLAALNAETRSAHIETKPVHLQRRRRRERRAEISHGA